MRRRTPDRLALAALFAVLAALHWGRWADPVVDFGRELYLAWRISAGERLYADLAHLHGPLSQWVNGAIFRFSGPSLRLLVSANLVVLALECHLLHRILRRTCGRAGAFAGTALFLGLFGFGDFSTYGVFNHATPYSHEATHGLLLALASLDAAFSGRAALGGFLWGLCSLSKPEPALAALLGLGALCADPRRTARFLLGAAAAPLACWAVLAPGLGPVGAARAAAGSWLGPLTSPAAVAGIYWRSFASAPVLSWDWLEWARWLPLALAVLAWRWRRHPIRRASAVFSLALLAKVLLAARIHQYGFTLAGPGVALLAAAAVGPARPRRPARWAAAFAVAALLLSGAGRSLARARTRSTLLGEGADAFLSDRRGAVVSAVLAGLPERLAPGATLAVWPEGAMLNYLARRRNPTPYLNLLPVELALWGEERVLAAYRSAPPDAIVLLHRETPEFGAALFGRDYGRGLAAWAQSEYVQSGTVGDPPLAPGSRFGARLLLKRPAPAGL